MRRLPHLLTLPIACAFLQTLAFADTTAFFRPCQTAIPVSSQVTSDTLRSNGYVFTLTRDKLFEGGTGHPIGRTVVVSWPVGVEGQAVTTPPPGVTDYHARIIVRRADGQPFDLTSFTAKLLANTSGAGGTIEIMPKLNGEDGLPNPVPFDATGVYGQTFSYDTSLAGFDTYDIALYVDFAFVALTLNSNAPGERSCCLAGGVCSDLTEGACALAGGLSQAAGTSCSCEPCAPGVSAAVPDGTGGTSPLLATRASLAGDVINLTWDASACPSSEYNLLYGPLADLAGYTLAGAVCAVGTSGASAWSGVPSGDLWYLIVGTDGVSTESSWGLDALGQERNGLAASGACGVFSKDVSRSCP